MRVILAVLSCALFASPAWADSRQPSPLARSIESEMIRVAKLPPAARQTSSGTSRSWAGRHPVLLGTLVGIPVGILVANSALQDNSNAEAGHVFVFGTLIGAGAGALVGLVVGALQK